jgi:thymidylate kinase
VLISQRISKMVELTHELKRHSNDTEKIKRLYGDAVRLSSRIYLAILALKYSEKTLNRPFVFKGIAYDEFMNKEIRVMRYKILKQQPDLQNDPDLRLFLKVNGDVGDTRISKRADYDLPKDYISDSSESEDEIQHRDSYQQIAQHSHL